jgi:nitroreductase
MRRLRSGSEAEMTDRRTTRNGVIATVPVLDLSVDGLLTTTRAVRKRLDLTRPVEPEVIRECLELAALYRRTAHAPGGQDDILAQMIASAADAHEAEVMRRKMAPAMHLTEHLHQIPVHVIPCVEGRAEDLPPIERAAHWGGIWPAVWSFMLAARSRGLGTVLTTLHLGYEREAAELLGVPYAEVMQVGLIPVAYTLGTSFKPAARKPLDEVVHWNRWEFS